MRHRSDNVILPCMQIFIFILIPVQFGWRGRLLNMPKTKEVVPVLGGVALLSLSFYILNTKKRSARDAEALNAKDDTKRNRTIAEKLTDLRQMGRVMLLCWLKKLQHQLEEGEGTSNQTFTTPQAEVSAERVKPVETVLVQPLAPSSAVERVSKSSTNEDVACRSLWEAMGRCFPRDAERIQVLKQLLDLGIKTLPGLRLWLEKRRGRSMLFSEETMQALNSVVQLPDRLIHMHMVQLIQRPQHKSMCSVNSIAEAINILLFSGFNRPASKDILPARYTGRLMLPSFNKSDHRSGATALCTPGPLTGYDVRDSEWMKAALRQKYSHKPDHPVHTEEYLTCVKTMVGNGDIVRAINSSPFSDLVVADMLIGRPAGSVKRFNVRFDIAAQHGIREKATFLVDAAPKNHGSDAPGASQPNDDPDADKLVEKPATQWPYTNTWSHSTPIRVSDVRCYQRAWDLVKQNIASTVPTHTSKCFTFLPVLLPRSSVVRGLQFSNCHFIFLWPNS